jgi:hypothetical protein
MFCREHKRHLGPLLTMQVIGHKPSDQKVSAYEAGLEDFFAACHDPMPAHMQQLLARVQDMEEHGEFGEARRVKRL